MRFSFDIAAIKARLAGLLQPRLRFAFLCAFFAGLAVHGFMLTNFLQNSDAVSAVLTTNDVTGLGRWFLWVASLPSSAVSAPWVLGLLCLLYLSLTAVVLCLIFGLHSRVSIFFVSVVLVGYPAVAATFSFFYTADAYMLALLLATVAVYATGRWRWGFLPGAFLLMLSLGIYQAYAAFAITLVLLRLVSAALRPGEQPRAVLFSALRYLAMGALGFIGNSLALNLVLRLRGISLSSYQDINILQQPLPQIFKTVFGGIPSAYTAFFENYLFTPGFRYSLPLRLLLVLYAAGVAALFVWLVARARAHKSPWRLCVVLGCVALLPLGVNALMLLSGQSFHALMRMAYALLFMLGPILLEKLGLLRAETYSGRFSVQKLAAPAALSLSLVLCWLFVLVSNIGYTNMALRQEKMFSLTTRLVDRMEQTEGYAPGMPMVVIGAFSTEYYPHESILDPLIPDMTNMRENSILVDPVNLQLYLRDFHNCEHQLIPGGAVEYSALDEVATMPGFPQAGCTRVLNGVLVIKLSEQSLAPVSY